MTTAHPIGDSWHLRLSANFERWIGICLRAGEPEQAERCRANAELHYRKSKECRDAKN